MLSEVYLVVAAVYMASALSVAVSSRSKLIKRFQGEGTFSIIAKIAYAASVLLPALYYLYRLIFDLNTPIRLGLILQLMSRAYAETQAGAGSSYDADVGRYLLIFVCGVFLFAFISLLFIKDNAENARKVSAVDTIVKTFGGLIMGLVSSMFNIHHP
jgi:hypothetical protein